MIFPQNRQARLNGNKMNEKLIIYVSVQGSIQHWYPVEAIQEHENCYRIVEINPDPEHFYWQFTTNEIVCCKENKFAENEFGLIALEKCNH